MNEEVFSTTSVLFPSVTSNALKHTRKFGQHLPFDSVLLATELAGLFIDKLQLRDGDIIPIDTLKNFKGKEEVYFELNSQTSDRSLFREMGGNLSPNGTCTVSHFLEHSDGERYHRKIGEMRTKPCYYKIKLSKDW